jgi:hypothetical protein
MLEFVSNTFTITAGDSIQIKIAAKDAGGNTDTSYNNTVTLISSSSTYSFSVSSTPWANTSIITLSSGVATYYYTDTQAGYPMLTISRDAGDLLPDTQSNIILPKGLGFRSVPFTITSITTSTIIATFKNADNSTATAWVTDTAIILTSSSKGKFSLTSVPWSDTTILQFSSGVCTFYYKDKTGGNPILTISRYTFPETQSDTVTMPVVTASKIQYNIRSGETTPNPVSMWPTDTIEYTIYITNTGSETATASIIMDTRVFDTYTNNSVEYIWMETSTVASTWSYSIDTPTLAWTTGSPSLGNIYIKGLKWKIDTLGINQTKAIRFRVRIR